ncbi:hypothetical protein [Egbenema bharatensis]|uniref:hypothetical protein n=1 Tax=Egbenema bharatensis TaxID=3463334 RepID=UPI003A8796B0
MRSFIPFSVSLASTVLVAALVAASVQIPGFTQALGVEPNQVDPPGRGWGEWQPIGSVRQANFNSGFSETEVNGVRELQALCASVSGQPIDAFPNWFRLSTLLDQVGTGQVEYGCWIDGRFAYTIINTAVRSDWGNIEQLLVDVGSGNNLVVYTEPTVDASAIGLVENGEIVTPSSFPALIVQNENRNWMYLTAPFEGWILQGPIGGQSNLRLSDRP